MLAAGAMATLARCAEILPLSVVDAALRVEVFPLPANVTALTAFVPDLYDGAVCLLGINNVHVVEPLFAKDIPTRRKYDDATVRQRREVVLDPPAAERVFDAMSLLVPGKEGFGDVIRPVSYLQAIGRAV